MSAEGRPERMEPGDAMRAVEIVEIAFPAGTPHGVPVYRQYHGSLPGAPSSTQLH